MLEARDYREPQDMHWQIYSENVTKILASDQQDSYSLKKLTETFENGSYAFHSPAEALLYDFLHEYSPRQKFWYVNLTSWTTYALLLLYLLAAAFIVIHYRNHQRLRILQAVAAQNIQLLPKARGFQLKQAVSTQQPQIANYVENLVQNLGQIRNLDFLLVALWISTIIGIIIVIVIIIRKLTRRSSLYVDISSGSNIAQVKLLDFPDATRSFSVITPKEPIQLRVKNLFCCGILAIPVNSWKVSNTLTGKTIKVPKYVIISPCKMAAVRKVLTQPHEVLPLVVHTREHLSPASNQNQEDSPVTQLV